MVPGGTPPHRYTLVDRWARQSPIFCRMVGTRTELLASVCTALQQAPGQTKVDAALILVRVLEQGLAIAQVPSLAQLPGAPLS